MINITRGNLLESPAEALVNTVNTVGVMGKGIALQFKKAFPDNFRVYKAACDRKEFTTGQMLVVECHILEGRKIIINFPTKRHWKGKSQMADVESGLKALVEEVRARGIRSIAVPPLGCGLGGLPWPEVRARIEQAFSELPEVEVYLYEPAGAPVPNKMINRTAAPRMTQGRAAVIGLISRYKVPGYEYLLSLLEIHKLAYFLVESGESLPKLEFAKAQYGPYADNLRKALRDMEGHFTEGFGDGSSNNPETPMKLLPGAVEKADAFLEKHPDTRERFLRVADLIEGFETPFGMELLATVHWVAARENAATAEDVIAKIHAWNDRKVQFSDRQIRIALDVLGRKGWLPMSIPAGLA
ncbi:MAG: macro domain-containing protein [Magnetococcales bacterium]|nr:macro domain-containing protein [Magnetococcales bacterium]